MCFRQPAPGLQRNLQQVKDVQVKASQTNGPAAAQIYTSLAKRGVSVSKRTTDNFRSVRSPLPTAPIGLSDRRKADLPRSSGHLSGCASVERDCELFMVIFLHSRIAIGCFTPICQPSSLPRRERPH